MALNIKDEFYLKSYWEDGVVDPPFREVPT